MKTHIAYLTFLLTTAAITALLLLKARPPRESINGDLIVLAVALIDGYLSALLVNAKRRQKPGQDLAMKMKIHFAFLTIVVATIAIAAVSILGTRYPGDVLKLAADPLTLLAVLSVAVFLYGYVSALLVEVSRKNKRS